MRVLQAYRTLDQAAGGPVAVVLGLGDGLAKMGTHVTVLDLSQHQTSPIQGCARLNFAQPRGLLGQFMLKLARSSDLMHIHGVWGKVPAAAYWSARKSDTPFVLTLHGILEPMALARHRWKKSIARVVYTDRMMRNARFVHALSTRELSLLRHYGFTGPAVIIPNGVHVPSEPPESSETGLEQISTKLVGRPFLLSLGRLHPVKRLEALLISWDQASRGMSDWMLAIAGPPDSSEYLRNLEDLTRKLAIENRVVFLGPRFGVEKELLFLGASGFVSMSEREGQSVAVLEAMSYGLPVVATQAVAQGIDDAAEFLITCGSDVGDMVLALRQFFALTSEEVAQIGAAARDFIQNRHSWGAIAMQMLEAYRWALGDGPRPDCVRLV
jgi:glycosyltransferase involved in cell wall biosynthesis